MRATPMWKRVKNPKTLVKHGKHVFMFRHVQTNQVLYSLYPGLDVRAPHVPMC